MSEIDRPDCPLCNKAGVHCWHSEAERIELRAQRAARNREKAKRKKANQRQAARDALMRGDRWI